MFRSTIFTITLITFLFGIIARTTFAQIDATGAAQLTPSVSPSPSLTASPSASTDLTVSTRDNHQTNQMQANSLETIPTVRVVQSEVERGQKITVNWENANPAVAKTVSGTDVPARLVLSDSQQRSIYLSNCSTEYPTNIVASPSGTCEFIIPVDVQPCYGMIGDSYTIRLDRDVMSSPFSNAFTIKAPQGGGTITGTMFYDRYCTKTYDPTFRNRPGVNQNLYAPAKGQTVYLGKDYNFELTTTTDSEGKFTFTNLQPGSYFVYRYWESGTNEIITSQNTSTTIIGNETKSVDLGFYGYDRYDQHSQECLSKPFVQWIHVDQYSESNGLQGLNDVTVKVLSADNSKEIATLKTANSNNFNFYYQSYNERAGFAEFTDLAEGSYNIVVSKDGYEGYATVDNSCYESYYTGGEWKVTQQTPITNNATEAHKAAHASITLGANNNGNCIAVALKKIDGSTPVSTPTADSFEYSATYWIDYNQNGQRDCDSQNRCDKGIEGIEISWSSYDGTGGFSPDKAIFSTKAKTDQNGFYQLKGLPKDAPFHILTAYTPTSYRCINTSFDKCQISDNTPKIFYSLNSNSIYPPNFNPHDNHNYDIALYPFEESAIKNLRSNESVNLNGNYYIAGDVEIDDITLFDNNSKSGSIIVFKGSGKVVAPWGATIIAMEERPAGFENTLQDEMKQNGCDGVCDEVIIQNWPGATGPVGEGVIKTGQKKKLPANTVISGDVKVNGVALYDTDNAETGLVVTLTEEAEVEAPWGAAFYTKTKDSVSDFVKYIVDLVKNHGCEGSCSSVDTQTYPQ